MISTQWWNVPWAPTPDEWQAFAAVATLITAIFGVLFAGYQLRLTALAEARAAKAAESEARPYVSVHFELRVLANGNPKSPNGEGLLFVIVESIGATPAREISLTVSPDFQSSGRGRPDGVAEDPALWALARIFSGEPAIGMLAPGQKLEYLLDFAAEAVGPDTGLPQRYDVTTSYWDASKEHQFSEPHILDLDPWRYSIAEPSPIDVIARQLRRVNENLEKRQ